MIQPPRLYLYLDAVARAGSIRKAAEKLRVASTALNRRILDFEKEIGRPLFERLPRGVRLTAAGEILIATIRRGMSDRCPGPPSKRIPPSLPASPWDRADTRSSHHSPTPSGCRQSAYLAKPGCDGMPIGFQLCAARNHDRALLEFARLDEASATWRSRWPDV